MNIAKSEINPQEVIDIINENLKAIYENFDPEKISLEGAENIITKIDEIEKIALSIKKKLRK